MPDVIGGMLADRLLDLRSGNVVALRQIGPEEPSPRWFSARSRRLALLARSAAKGDAERRSRQAAGLARAAVDARHATSLAARVLSLY
jgi:hypothetical protein